MFATRNSHYGNSAGLVGDRVKHTKSLTIELNIPSLSTNCTPSLQRLLFAPHIGSY